MDISQSGNLGEYFAALDERLDEILPARVSLLAHICGYTVRLVFPILEYARYVIPNMFVRPDNGTSVDATFIWWEDRILPYQLNSLAHFKHKHTINTEHQGIDVFQAEDTCGYVEIIGSTLRAENYKKNRYYLMLDPSIQPKWSIICHPFEKAIFSWAQKHNLFMVHAAAVGVDGHGVLIVGHGGTGKSTLACSCLASDCDFVSDDLCLLTTTGIRTVFPIYTNVCLKPDSYSKLPLFRPFEIFPQQGEKSSFIIGETRIKPSLPVEAIILPRITDNKEPEIEIDRTTKALGQLVYSTAKQRSRFQETGFVRNLSQRILGMPVYRFSLTKDLEQNCQYLKKWIREDLSCLN